MFLNTSTVLWSLPTSSPPCCKSSLSTPADHVPDWSNPWRISTSPSFGAGPGAGNLHHMLCAASLPCVPNFLQVNQWGSQAFRSLKSTVSQAPWDKSCPQFGDATPTRAVGISRARREAVSHFRPSDSCHPLSTKAINLGDLGLFSSKSLYYIVSNHKALQCCRGSLKNKLTQRQDLPAFAKTSLASS